MQVAVQFERSSIPSGMVRQKDIGSPKMRVSTPVPRSCAAAASPYGPAPRIATSLVGFRPGPRVSLSGVCDEP
jgi:hypothetical protein